MKYLDLINRFWEENRSNRFTTSECALYFYLLNEGNRKYWKMPFSCSSALIIAETGLTKSTLVRARDGLRSRKLISFMEGVQNSRAPTYIITDADTYAESTCETAQKAKSESVGKEKQETAGKKEGKTDKDTKHEIAPNTISKDKDKNLNKIEENKALMPISEIEKRMLEDENWQKLVLSQLSQMGYDAPRDNNLTTYIHQFFNFQRISNVSEREEGDCRQHFFNKLKKEYLSKNNYGSNQFERNNRRGSLEVSPTSKENYESAF